MLYPLVLLCAVDAAFVNVSAPKSGKVLKTPDDVCDDIRDNLPDFCSMPSCDFTKKDGVDIKCKIDLSIEAFDLEAKLNICDETEGAGISFHIEDEDLKISWDHTFRAGDDVDIPIPGLSIDVGIASAGVDLDAGFTISASAVDITAGINACAEILFGKICGSDLPVIGSVLPINLLDLEFDYQTVCTGPPPPPTPTPPPGPTPPPPKPPAPPAPTGEYHFADPQTTSWACLDDEQNTGVTGLDGGFCSPTCADSKCPTDIPPDTTAVPACVLTPAARKLLGLKNPRVKDAGDSCALICMATDGSYLQCPDGASCLDIQNTAVCTYDDDVASMVEQA
jgi:hypothetical protein